MKSFTCFAFFAASMLMGCAAGGPPRVKVTGELHKNSKLLKIHTSVMRDMVFVPKNGAKDARPIPAVVKDDGTFEVPSIPAGKYLIALQLIGDGGDMCKGMFPMDSSKLIRTIDGKAPIMIEITKPTGE